MAFPSEGFTVEYRNFDASTVDMSACNLLVVGVIYANYDTGDTDAIGLRITVTDILAASDSVEYLYDDSSPIPEPSPSWETCTVDCMANILFPQSSFSGIDWSQVSNVKLEVGVLRSNNGKVSICYIGTGTDTGLADCPGGGGGGGGG